MARPYDTDLAYTHDVGFGAFAEQSAPGLLALLRQHGIEKGLVVDLGCGSGIWARTLTGAGYDVFGVDYSRAMIALARKKAPRARFRHGSYLNVALPPCAAVTSIGECLCYLFDRDGDDELAALFERVHSALRPGGVFIFDIVQPGLVPGGKAQRRHRTGDDWAVMVEVEEDRAREVLTRNITCFRLVGRLYRRSEEVHRQRLYRGRDLAVMLSKVGFRIRLLRGYGQFRLGRGRAVLVARKP
jgi:SAM-dependent methyltransferase